MIFGRCTVPDGADVTGAAVVGAAVSAAVVPASATYTK